MGIVTNKTLWASDIHYLNDSEELRNFGSRLDAEILARIESGHSQIETLKQLRTWLPSRISGGPMLFVGSFTENGNLLSQWRGYCPHGKGVSIGFEPDLLVASAHRASFSFGRCVYDQVVQGRIAGEVVDNILELARGSEPSLKHHVSQSWHELFQSIEPLLLRIAALMKHSSFREEQEWRLVSQVFANYVKPPILYREGVSTLLPYLEIPLPTKLHHEKEALAILHTIIGPTPSPNLSMGSVSKYLSRAGVAPNRVSNSGIPYRRT